jgi:hypothetical protein
MTLEDARIVAEILAAADDGCERCALKLAEAAQDAFPIDGFDWRVAVLDALNAPYGEAK